MWHLVTEIFMLSQNKDSVLVKNLYDSYVVAAILHTVAILINNSWENVHGTSILSRITKENDILHVPREFSIWNTVYLPTESDASVTF
jgi:hypothetical protein